MALEIKVLYPGSQISVENEILLDIILKRCVNQRILNSKSQIQIWQVTVFPRSTLLYAVFITVNHQSGWTFSHFVKSP